MAITINGSTGIQMAADDSLEFGTVGISQDNLFSGRKNVIINGDFDVWQRGTSFTGTTSEYTADRWECQAISSTHTVTQQSFTLGQTDIPNEPKYWLRNVVTTGGTASSLTVMAQKIEDVRTLAGQTTTLTFYAKADTAKDIAVEFEQYFGTGGSPSASVQTTPTTISLTTSWQKFEVTVAVPSISGKTIGTNENSALQVYFWLDGGSNFNARTNSLGNQSGTFDIAQVQLEKGSQATAFEKRSYGEELALCYRYFRSWGGLKTFEVFAPLTAYSNTASTWIYPLEVELRTDTPTLTITGSWIVELSGISSSSVSTLTLGSSACRKSIAGGVTYPSNANFTGNKYGWIQSTNTSARITVDAEL